MFFYLEVEPKQGTSFSFSSLIFPRLSGCFIYEFPKTPGTKKHMQPGEGAP
jgi:hypothetical protein